MRLSSLLLASLTIPSLAFGADSLECGVQRRDSGAALSLHGEFSDGAAQAATSGATNELGLGLDASLSPQSLFLVLEDTRAATRAAFTASPKGASAYAFTLGSGEGSASCVKREENPVKAMPAHPALPDYFVCVLDELTYMGGSVTATKRLARKVVSTALFRMPVSLEAKGGDTSFRVKLYRMDFQKGLDVVLRDEATGRDARFTGPAATLQGSFLLGLTQGNRLEQARFLRLGCLFVPEPTSLP